MRRSRNLFCHIVCGGKHIERGIDISKGKCFSILRNFKLYTGHRFNSINFTLQSGRGTLHRIDIRSYIQRRRNRKSTYSLFDS